jgi:hypothetical protein
MGLSGTTAAYKQARAGIGRFGASRFNWFTYNIFVSVADVDVSDYVMFDTLVVSQALNDEPDTAQFTIRSDSPVLVFAGQSVVVSIGSFSNREFGGQVARVTSSFVKTAEGPLTHFEIEAIDYGRLFDRRLVVGEYVGWSATDIANAVIDNYTSGFTRKAVAAGLPTIDSFPVTNEAPQAVLRRLANLIDGGFFVDAFRDVHLFGSGGDTASTAGTNPAQLTSTLPSLREFRYQHDITQVRTRAIVEGGQTTALLGSPGSTTADVVVSVDYVLVAGGGSGGHNLSAVNAGGGGGGVLEGSAAVSTGAFAVVIGGGGAVASPGASGGNTTAFGLTALGGGKGSADSGFGTDGGCGGGGTGTHPALRNGGAGTSGQGYNGGFGGYYFDSDLELFFSIGGGGGGAGGVGGSAQYNLDDTGAPGEGGIGRLSAISGTPTYYGGGGGGRSGTGQTNAGGLGGGGATAVAGTANSGGGGGAGASGGSGIAIMRYRTEDMSATGGTITTSGAYTIHTFTSNGTFTVTTVTRTVLPTGITSIPVADAAKLDDAAGTVRIGNYVIAYTGTLGPVLTTGENPPAVAVTADTAAGATSLPVGNSPLVITEATGWVKVNEQILYFSASSTTALTIPAAGIGSLKAAVKAAAQVTWLGAVEFTYTTFDPPFAAGVEVVQRITVNDLAAQVANSSNEGGDGIHEVLISDDRLSTVGAQGRGAADLSQFSASTGIVDAEWTTIDLNARPGRRQAISFDGIVATLMITRVTITFPLQIHRPVRRCQASSLKVTRLTDVVAFAWGDK